MVEHDDLSGASSYYGSAAAHNTSSSSSLGGASYPSDVVGPPHADASYDLDISSSHDDGSDGSALHYAPATPLGFRSGAGAAQACTSTPQSMASSMQRQPCAANASLEASDMALRELQEKYEETRQQVKDRDHEKLFLRNRAKSAQTRAEYDQKRNRALARKQRWLSRQIDEQAEEIACLKTELDHERGRLRQQGQEQQQQQQQSDLGQQLELRRGELEQKQEQLTQQQGEIDELRGKLQRQVRQQAQHEHQQRQQRTELEQQRAELEQQRDELEQQQDVIDMQQDQLQQQSSSFEQQRDELEQTFASRAEAKLRKAKQRLKDRHAQEQEVAESAAQARLEQQLQALQKTLTTAHQLELQTANSAARELRASLQEHQRATQALRRTATVQKKKISKLRRRLLKSRVSPAKASTASRGVQTVVAEMRSAAPARERGRSVATAVSLAKDRHRLHAEPALLRRPNAADKIAPHSRRHADSSPDTAASLARERPLQTERSRAAAAPSFANARGGPAWAASARPTTSLVTTVPRSGSSVHNDDDRDDDTSDISAFERRYHDVDPGCEDVGAYTSHNLDSDDDVDSDDGAFDEYSAAGGEGRRGPAAAAGRPGAVDNHGTDGYSGDYGLGRDALSDDDDGVASGAAVGAGVAGVAMEMERDELGEAEACYAEACGAVEKTNQHVANVLSAIKRCTRQKDKQPILGRLKQVKSEQQQARHDRNTAEAKLRRLQRARQPKKEAVVSHKRSAKQVDLYGDVLPAGACVCV